MAHNNTIFIARLLLAAGCSFLFPSIYSPPAPKKTKNNKILYTQFWVLLYIIITWMLFMCSNFSFDQMNMCKRHCYRINCCRRLPGYLSVKSTEKKKCSIKYCCSRDSGASSIFRLGFFSLDKLWSTEWNWPSFGCHFPCNHRSLPSVFVPFCCCLLLWNMAASCNLISSLITKVISTLHGVVVAFTHTHTRNASNTYCERIWMQW